MKYIALIEQQNPGCDYTIGCGKKWIELQATDKESAFSELKSIIIGKRDDGYTSGYNGRYWGDATLSEVTLLEVSNIIPIAISYWYKDAQQLISDEKKQRDAQLVEIQERLEYVRLKDKYAKD